MLRTLVGLMRFVPVVCASVAFELVWPREPLGTTRKGTYVGPLAGI
jgi:hypothetical protein